MSLWQSFRSLQPRTRMYIGIGIMAYSTLGLVFSSKAEQSLGLIPTEKDHEVLREMVPKIRTVEGE